MNQAVIITNFTKLSVAAMGIILPLFILHCVYQSLISVDFWSCSVKLTGKINAKIRSNVWWKKAKHRIPLQVNGKS